MELKTNHKITGNVGINFSDVSLWAIIGGNILTMVLAYVEGWSMGPILWIYWAQSVTIGLANVVRMLTLKEFSTKGLKMNNSPVPETQAAKKQVAFFFMFHYGFFHFIYAIFLMQDTPLGDSSLWDIFFMAVCILGFATSHFYSLFHNKGQDFRQKKPNLGTLMFYPYIRIIPMHLIIIVGSTMGGGVVIALFMMMKTVADAGMHMVEHYLFRRSEKERLEMKD